MSKYRPAGWECEYQGKKANRYFELGADAMLDKLKADGQQVNNNGLSPYGMVLARELKRGEKGTIVFIPDDPKEIYIDDPAKLWTLEEDKRWEDDDVITRANFINISHYKYMWQTHKATKVIEKGYLCPGCNMPIRYFTNDVCYCSLGL